MRMLIRRISLSFVLLLLTLTLGACSRLTAPVDPFFKTPETTGELLNALAKRHPEVDHMVVKMQVQVSEGAVGGWRNVVLYALFESPDQVQIRADFDTGVELIRVTQNGNRAAVLLPQQGKFYKGALADLDKRPELVFGVRPADIVRTMLVGQEIVKCLRNAAPNLKLPASPPGFNHWALFSDPAFNRREAYYLRRTDGVVEKVGIHDEKGALQVVVSYGKYDLFDGVMFPSQFDLKFTKSDFQVKVKKVEYVNRLQEMGEEVFILAPPAGSGITPQPFEAWFAEMGSAQ